MERIYEVADWFLSKEPMTQKKLQKLVYYAYAWFLVLRNESIDELEHRLFDQKAEAWVHGPVYPCLWHKYKEYGWQEINKTEIEFSINDDIEEFLEAVWKAYGEFNGDELETLTHQEIPWINARGDIEPYKPSNNNLNDVDIFKEYASR